MVILLNAYGWKWGDIGVTVIRAMQLALSKR